MPHTTCSYFTQHPHPQSANSSLISVTSAPLCSALLVSMYMCSKTTVNVMLLPQQLQCCPLVLSTTEKTTQQTGQNCKQAPKNFSFPSSCVVLWCIAPPSFVTMPIKGQPAELTVYSLEKPPPPPPIYTLSLSPNRSRSAKHCSVRVYTATCSTTSLELKAGLQHTHSKKKKERKGEKKKDIPLIWSMS